MAISANDLLQDIPCGFGPDEGLGIRIVMGDVTINSLDEFWHTGEYATA